MGLAQYVLPTLWSTSKSYLSDFYSIIMEGTLIGDLNASMQVILNYKIHVQGSYCSNGFELLFRKSYFRASHIIPRPPLPPILPPNPSPSLSISISISVQTSLDVVVTSDVVHHDASIMKKGYLRAECGTVQVLILDNALQKTLMSYVSVSSGV